MKIMISFLLATILLSAISPLPATAEDDLLKSDLATCFNSYKSALEAIDASEQVCNVPKPTKAQSDACGSIRKANNQQRKTLKIQHDECIKKLWEKKVNELQQQAD